MARDDNERMMTGLFPNRASAEQGYSSLMSCGYRADDVSVLMMDETRKRQFPADAPKTELGTKATEGAGLGAVTGGTLGPLPPALGPPGLPPPGIPIIALGPLAAVLSGAGLGGAVGGLIGAFVGAGLPEGAGGGGGGGPKRGGV